MIALGGMLYDLPKAPKTIIVSHFARLDLREKLRLDYTDSRGEACAIISTL
jgi:hypothetical protein